MRILSVGFVSILIAACATDRAEFQPTERVQATSPGGQPAAVYDVGRPGEAEVRVWSRGAYERDGQTYVQLAVEARNTSDRPIWLDTRELQLQAFDEQGRVFPPAHLIQFSSQSNETNRIEPRSAATLNLTYAMPGIGDPDRINSMRLRWAIAREDGTRDVQFTGFRRIPDPTYEYASWSYYDPVFGYYDPFFLGPRYVTPVRRVIVVERDRHRSHVPVRHSRR